MGLKATIKQDSYDALDESDRSRYQQTGDGSWVLQVEDLDSHPQVRGLVQTLAKFREIAPDARAMKALKDRAETLEQAWDGLDPEETRSRLERLSEYEAEGKPDVKARIEQARKEAREVMDREIAKKDTEIKGLQDQLQDRQAFIERLTIDGEFDRALDKGDVLKGLRAGAKSLLKDKHRPNVERVVNEETGEVEYRGVVKTPMGESSVSDFVAQWLTTPEGQEYLPSSGNMGTNSKTGDGSGPRNINPFAKDTENLTEQGRLIKSNPTLARQMAESAGVRLNWDNI